MKNVALGAVFVGFAVAGCSAPEQPPLPEVPPPPSRRPSPPPPPPRFDDFARRDFSFPLDAESAEQILTRTEVFAWGTGPFRQVQAFNVVYDQPDTLKRFERIALSGRPAGQLYALCGLTLLDTPEAERLRAILSGRSDRLTVLDSDVVNERSVQDMVTAVSEYRLGQELRSAKKRTEAYFRGEQPER